MSDNLSTQSATPSTFDPSTRIATVEGSFSGQSAHAGIGVAGEVSGAEGARTISVLGLIDSGYAAVATGSLTAVPTIGASTVLRLDGLFFANPTGAAITIRVTDGSDKDIVPTQNVPAGGQLPFSFNGKPTTGLKWISSSASLYGQAWGRTAV